MSTTAKWDRHYLAQVDGPVQPALVLAENTHLLPDGGSALDLACGMGGNALLLARRGLAVTAWDISSVAVGRLNEQARAENLPITAEVRDLNTTGLAADTYDVVVVSRFLSRVLNPSIVACLRPQGLLFYQTFTAAKITSSGPSRADYLLGENELLRSFSSLMVHFYREDARCGDLSTGRRDEAYFIGQKLSSEHRPEWNDG